MCTYYVIEGMIELRTFSWFALIKALVFDAIGVYLGLAWS